MLQLSIKAEIEGHRPVVYKLKEQLENLLSQTSCRYDLTLTGPSGIEDSISVSAQAKEIKVDEVIDLSLSGDDMYELLEYK